MRSLLMGGLDFDVCVRDTLDVVVLGRARASIITMLRVSSSPAHPKRPHCIWSSHGVYALLPSTSWCSPPF
jgi:hypothetical protein